MTELNASAPAEPMTGEQVAKLLDGDRLRRVVSETLIAYWALDRERETDRLDIATAESHAFTIVEALRLADLPITGESIYVRDSIRAAIAALDGEVAS